MGRDLFNKRMTEFFNYPEPGWYAQYYNPYNETDLAGAVHLQLLRPSRGRRRGSFAACSTENYTDTPDGIPGNDDCGEMSSWAVLSMMGIYSVDPASLAYELVAPSFPKVTVRLAAPYTGKSFTIEAPGAKAGLPYVQSVELNGKTHTKNWISFKSIADGGMVEGCGWTEAE